MRTHDLAVRLGGRLEGGPDVDLLGVAPVETARAHQLAFLAKADHPHAALSSAGCLLVPDDFANATGRAVVRVRRPRLAFARAVPLLVPTPVPNWIVHPTAVVEARAVLGPGVRIGPFCFVANGARLGANTILHSHVAVHRDVQVGERCILHSGVVLGGDGFGFEPAEPHLEKVPQIGTVEIGDDVEIGANTTIDRGTLGVTRIGSGTKIDNLVHVAHNCTIGRHVVIAAQTGIAGGATVGDWAVLGGQVGIGDRARIDARAVVASRAAVPSHKRIAAGEPVWGVPARPLGQHLRQLAELGRIADLRARIDRLERRLAAADRSPHERG